MAICQSGREYSRYRKCNGKPISQSILQALVKRLQSVDTSRTILKRIQDGKGIINAGAIIRDWHICDQSCVINCLVRTTLLKRD